MAGCDLLLTGISGLLGATLALDLAGKYRLAGTCHARRAELPGVAVRPVDLAEAGRAGRGRGTAAAGRDPLRGPDRRGRLRRDPERPWP
jgi:hypothetical protein